MGTVEAAGDADAAAAGGEGLFDVALCQLDRAGVVHHYGRFRHDPPDALEEGAALAAARARLGAGARVRLRAEDWVRDRNAKIHSAGHLIDIAFANLGYTFPATKGYHFPKGAYVEYTGKVPAAERPALIEALNGELAKLVAADAPTEVRFVEPGEVAGLSVDGKQPDLSYLGDGERARMVFVGGAKGCCCGGTHVARAGALEGTVVTKLKNKKKQLRISYSVEGATEK